MNIFLSIVAVVDGILVVCGALALLIKPMRVRIFKDKEQREGRAFGLLRRLVRPLPHGGTHCGRDRQ